MNDVRMSPRREGIPPLTRSALQADPIDQFASWFAVAQGEAPLAEAMTLATADAQGVPDARMVLLKGFGADGFRFFTNYESDKGRQLDSRGLAALVVYWRELDRQVRVRGFARRLTAADSDAYFATRPRDSQIAASISRQSRPVADRAELERLYAEAEQRLGDGDVPRPAHWGGYLVEHAAVEFWQGREGRLHDRFRYTRDGEGWDIERLAP
jgi:pyridoxamine 5'-phosphate oxidase